MASRRKQWTCGGKVRYPDQQAAKDAVRVIRYRHGVEGTPKRAYECEQCGGFHLTSQPAKKYPSLI